MNLSPRHIKIVLHLFLIIWGCGLGPLTYFERLSAHRGVQAGSFSVLGIHLAQNPQLPPEIKAIVYNHSATATTLTLRRLQAQQQTPALSTTERSPLNTLLNALTSGELLHTSPYPHNLRIARFHPIDQPPHLPAISAFLAPPAKPPSRANS